MSQNTTETSMLTLGFNPRSLLSEDITCLTTLRTSHESISESPQLDAIFVVTKNRPQHLNKLLLELEDTKTPVYILATVPTDVPARLFEGLQHRPNVEIIYGQAYDNAFSDPCVMSGAVPAYESKEWDIPKKRNYALSFARNSGMTKVLLLDDDIRGLSVRMFENGARALDHFTVAGPYVDHFPDLSAVGHASRQLGNTVYTFLSGSCLFIRIPSVRAFFPSIYNEDWLFILPHILTRSAVSVDKVHQLAYDPYKPTVARFQEFGEVIADGLYSLLCHGRFSYRNDASTWKTLLALRRHYLGELISRTRSVKLLTTLNAALDVSCGITPNQCMEFVIAWDDTLRLKNAHLADNVQIGLR